MDPNAALERIRELLVELDQLSVTRHEPGGEPPADELRELVSGLDDWLVQGGFLPAEWAANREAPNAQANALLRVMAARKSMATVREAFDLPDGYWFVQFADGFECGIAPDGSVSS